MQFQSYNAELAIANLMFKRIFANIRIERTDRNGKKSTIPVGCIFDQRSRVLKSLENPERRGNIKIPLITINRSGYSRNGDRLSNLHNEVKFELASNNRLYELMTPIPIDINYEVSIIAKYKQDLDKIASNFMVFFNSDIYVSCQHPKYEGLKMNNQIIMQDSVTEEHSSELDSSQDDFIINTFQFTFKTYLFAGMERFQKIHRQQISTYVSSIISTKIVQIDYDKIDDFQNQYPENKASAIIILNPDEIDDFQNKYPNKPISSEISTMIQTEISVIYDGDEIYDGIPQIANIDFGFYPTPTISDHVQYMKDVDSGKFGEHEHLTTFANVSNYTSSNVPCYIPVDNYCTLEPYVDKIYWEIDTNTGILTSQRI